MPELLSEPVPALLAGQAAWLIDDHDGGWDGMYAFTSLHWDGGELKSRYWLAIDPEIDPSYYSSLMFKTAQEICADHPDCPPYACGLRFEGFGTDNREFVMAVVADLHGRMWSKQRFRNGSPDEEGSWPADHLHRAGLQIALKATARATAIKCWGIEPTPGEARALRVLIREMN